MNVRRLASTLLLVSSLGYTVVLIGLSIAWMMAPEARWWIAFSNLFAPVLFLPLIFLLPGALWLKSRWIYACVAIGVGLFGVLFWPRLMPKFVPAQQANLRVVTFNQLFTSNNAELLVQAIQEQQADVVAIQELSPVVAELITRDLKASYPYQYLDPADNSGGLGLLSRYPFTTVEPLKQARGIKTQMTYYNQQITLVNVHIHFSGISRFRTGGPLGLPYIRGYDVSGRSEQINSLMQEVIPGNNTILMMGDFNTGDREPPYQLLQSQFRDVFADTSWGFGFTFPNNKRFGPLIVPVPLVRIDYIWSRGPIQPVASAVNCNNGGSDHCLIVADLFVSGLPPRTK